MKYFILTTTFLYSALFSFGQEQHALGVFESDTTWLKEIIVFPIDFAPEIKYDGYEDLRFAKKWRDQTHDEFWTYTFAWHITNIEGLDEKLLETDIKYYYDGIRKAMNKKKNFKVPETSVLFVKANHENKAIDFIGKIHVYDSFNIERMITLNVRVKVNRCNLKKSTTIVFSISPQDFSHSIWNRFEAVKLRSDYCD